MWLKILILSLILSSCNTLNRSLIRKSVVPELQTKSSPDSQPESHGAIIDSIELGDQGKPRKADLFIISLDYLPEPIAGTAGVPECLKIPDELEVGIAHCVEGNQNSVVVFGKNFLRKCRLFPDRSVSLGKLFLLPGCVRARVVFHKFNPAVRAEVRLL